LGLGGSAVAAALDDAHRITLWICLGLIVFLVLLDVSCGERSTNQAHKVLKLFLGQGQDNDD